MEEYYVAPKLLNLAIWKVWLHEDSENENAD